MGGPHGRRPGWQIQHELRLLVLSHCDFDLVFQRRLRRLAKHAAATLFPSPNESLEETYHSAAIMVEDAAALVRSYVAAVRDLAHEFGLDRIGSEPGIADSDGAGMIHAWVTRRPHPSARFSGSPWTRGGAEPARRVTVTATWEPSREDWRRFRSRMRHAVDIEVRRLEEQWRAGTRVTRRKVGARDSRFVFERIRFRRTYSTIAAHHGNERLGEIEIRQAVERLAQDAGVLLRPNS